MKILEDILEREDTKDNTEQYKINVKVNRYGGIEDNQAYKMIHILKDRGINLSRHIRMLLAMEFSGNITFAMQQTSRNIPFSEPFDEIVEEEDMGIIGDEDIFG